MLTALIELAGLLGLDVGTLRLLGRRRATILLWWLLVCLALLELRVRVLVDGRLLVEVRRLRVLVHGDFGQSQQLFGLKLCLKHSEASLVTEAVRIRGRSIVAQSTCWTRSKSQKRG